LRGACAPRVEVVAVVAALAGVGARFGNRIAPAATGANIQPRLIDRRDDMAPLFVVIKPGA
jgi:hypothetical protein